MKMSQVRSAAKLAAGSYSMALQEIGTNKPVRRADENAVVAALRSLGVIMDHGPGHSGQFKGMIASSKLLPDIGGLRRIIKNELKRTEPASWVSNNSCGRTYDLSSRNLEDIIWFTTVPGALVWLAVRGVSIRL